MLPCAPESVDAGEGFRVFPPACGPPERGVPGADAARVHKAQPFAHELVGRTVNWTRARAPGSAVSSIAPLPTYIGGRDPGLVCVLPETFSIRRSYYAIVPENSLSLRRVGVVLTAIRDIVAAHPDLDALGLAP